jgi:hypothetical protein
MTKFMLIALLPALINASIDGRYICTETTVTKSGTGPSSTLWINITGPAGQLVDAGPCKAGCAFTTDFATGSTGVAGYYNSTADGDVHGIIALGVDAGSGLLGLRVENLFSGTAYTVKCKNPSNGPSGLTTYTGKSLDGDWDGTEGRISDSGVGATSSLTMKVTGDTARFVDSFGCTSGCTISADFGYNKDVGNILGLYHDPDGSIHGIWFMFMTDEGVPFAFTTSFASGYSYVLDWAPSPPCQTPGLQCNAQTRTFGSTCGSWVVWRPVDGQDFIHQAFAYDDQYHTHPTSASFALNSGYYSCGDDGKSGSCVSCGSSALSAAGVTCYGRVCQDNAHIQIYKPVLSHDGLSDLNPYEELKTCWFLDPSKGQSMNCEALWQAEQRVQTKGDFQNQCVNLNAKHYSLTSHNCRYYVEAVMKEYCSAAPGKGAPVCAC